MEQGIRVERRYVGSIEVVGNALVFGLAYRPGSQRVAYLDLVGPRTSVEAVWGRLLSSRGETAWLRMTDGTLKQLQPSEGLKRFQVALDGLGQDNLVAVVEKQDNEEDRYSYLLGSERRISAAALLSCLKDIWRGPLFIEWMPMLLSVGQVNKLATWCETYGGVEMLAVLRSADKWEAAIKENVEAGILRLCHRVASLSHGDAARWDRHPEG